MMGKWKLACILQPFPFKLCLWNSRDHILYCPVSFRILISSKTERLNWIYFGFQKHLHLNMTGRHRAHPVSALDYWRSKIFSSSFSFVIFEMNIFFSVKCLKHWDAPIRSCLWFLQPYTTNRRRAASSSHTSESSSQMELLCASKLPSSKKHLCLSFYFLFLTRGSN